MTNFLEKNASGINYCVVSCTKPLMSPHANTWDKHVFRSLNLRYIVLIEIYSYTSKDRQSF